MKTLTVIPPPTLWGSTQIKVENVAHEFDCASDAQAFALRNDIRIITTELNSIINKCNFYVATHIADIHKAVLLSAVHDLIYFKSSGELVALIDTLENEVIFSIDKLQNICSSDTMSIIDQAKGLVILFILKYKI